MMKASPPLLLSGILLVLIPWFPTGTCFSPTIATRRTRNDSHRFQLLNSHTHLLRNKKNYHRRDNNRVQLHAFDPLVFSDFSTSLSTSVTLSSGNNIIDASTIAKGLGYLVGGGAVLLYTPIIVRLLRQQSADGLVVSTWWLKLISYTCSIVYNFDKGYPLSTYLETVVLATEATIVLGLVSYFQDKLDAKFGACAIALVAAISIALNDSITPPELLALGQACAAIINVFAVLPQFQLNYQTQTSGDYSPVTATLASTGCAIRIFTTIQLAGSDPILLASTSLALLLNGSLLLQILYYGINYENKSLVGVLTADYATTTTTAKNE